MRWSELAGKDIINIENANRLGRVDDADLVIREDGSIESLVASSRGRWRHGLTIAWDRVVKIGPEAMLVALPDGGGAPRRGRATSVEPAPVWSRDARPPAGTDASPADAAERASDDPPLVVRVTTRRDGPSSGA
ncbi:MAG: YlmC/YmxH family sporulation protein [Clostridia bacterium]|nr:YlmC/YmxH family sporulation protein [Clostridia bacterium]